MALRIVVATPISRQQFVHDRGPLEFGRGPGNGARRFVVDDPGTSRDQLRLEELPTGLIRVANLSRRRAVTVVGGETIGMCQLRELEGPLCLAMSSTQITVERVPDSSEPARADDGLVAEPGPASHRVAVAPGDESPPPGLVAVAALTPGRVGGGLESNRMPALDTTERLTEWLHTIVDLQRAAAGSAEFFDQTARAILELVGMDLGMVLLARDGSWTIAASAAVGSDVPVRYSRTLVAYVAKSGKTFYQGLDRLTEDAVSLLMIEAAVAAPVFGMRGEVVGVLYGARGRGLIARGPIGPLEAQLVQLLAAAASANLTRSMALRTRIQFEQFFSPELVRELEQHPDLLEARSQDVTLLFSDLRGFTSLSQRLGAETTCRIVRDMMEHLSAQIVDHGGVIVDYAGDGILAMWNAPTPQADHADRACRAALGMLGEMPQINRNWGPEARDALSLGIGINSGPAQVGNTGSSRKFKYGPHGHSVNLASRVQDATKTLGLPLLITASVRDQLPPAMETRRLGQVRLPGVETPTVLFELQGDAPAREWVRLRDTYEKGLAMYEAGQWSRACRTVAPLLAAAGEDDRYDIPTLKLLRRAWECLESRPSPFVPIIDVSAK
jgi:adenylate cyclase